MSGDRRARAISWKPGTRARLALESCWSYEEFLAACLQRDVSARDAHGGEGRIRAARFPARGSLVEFDYDHARGLRRETIAHLGTLDFVTKDNVVFVGPTCNGKTHLAIGLAIRAYQAGHRVLFATASKWVDRLATAHHAGRLQDELRRLGRCRCWSSTKSATFPSNPKPRTCSTNWCPPATNGPR